MLESDFMTCVAAGKLHERWYDREDKVRLEVVRAVCEAAADNIQAVPQMVSWRYTSRAAVMTI